MSHENIRMKPKTFKAQPWLINGIKEIARAEGYESDGEWIRKILLKEVLKAGYDPQTFFIEDDTNTDQ